MWSAISAPALQIVQVSTSTMFLRFMLAQNLILFFGQEPIHRIALVVPHKVVVGAACLAMLF